MAIRCPYCQHGMEVRGAKPGRFTPSCPKCQLRFVLTIPVQAGATPVVAELAQAPDEDRIDANIAAILGIDDRDESLAGAPASHGLTPGHATAATMPPPTHDDTDFDVAATDADGRLSHANAVAATSPPPARLTHATMPPAAHISSQRHADPAATAATPDEQNRAAHQARAGSAAVAQGPIVDVVHQTLGGYQLLQRLGQGGMGAVYLARQMSLDRNVAVKVLHPQWAGDAQFVARFTREAYAAAQLVHHNVVQIHDIGAQEQTHFYSMEFVPGQTLADLVRRHGRLEAEVAVNYILQAARGLKFAHDRGMIHRDIKPENLLLNDEGLVKVADLGLVKTPGSLETLPGGRESSHGEAHGEEHAGAHTTRHNSAMGTPLYMPPEQAKDAAHVDARADIYSLGCTLYALLTAQPPFTGSTAAEVIAKHAAESPVPPDQLVRRVPESLSAIVLKMMAKRPENRYKDIASVIAALEEFLGIDGSQPVHAREDHIHILEDCVATYHEAPLAGMRPKLIGAFLGALFVLIATAAFTGHPILAAGLFGFSVMTVAAYFAISGVLDRTVLFRKARLWAWHSGWRDWIKGVVAVILVVAILFVLGWLWVWLAFAVLAVAAAAAFHWMVDRPLARAHAGSLERTRMLLRQMRSRGMDESAIRHFVCKYAGDRWEEFYEALFGYEAKIDARMRWGSDERGRPRPRFRGWRDGVIAWVDRQEAERREAATRRVLQVVETKGLEASGVDAMHARQKAKRRAEAMVAKAAELRHSPTRAAFEVTDAASLNFDKLFDAGGEPKHVSRHHEGYLGRRYGGPAEWIIGPPMRFAAAIVLLACFTLWLYQNKQVAQRGFTNLWSAARVEPPTSGKQVMDRAIEIRNYGDEVSRSARELSIPLVPQAVTQRLGGFHAAVAGLILLALSFFRGVILSLLGWLAAAIAVIGHEFTAGAGGLGAEMFALAIAVALTFIAFIFFRQPVD